MAQRAQHEAGAPTNHTNHGAAADSFKLPVVEHTQPPHPDWQPGQAQPIPYPGTGFRTADWAEIGGSAMYPLVISAVVPRPIAFISTLSPEGVGNLSPYSYFNAVAHDPPHVAIGLCTSPARGGHKDSMTNIAATGEFVVCLISEWFVEAANQTCGNYDPGVNEMTLTGLTPLPSVKVKPPRVAESAVHLECKLRHTYDVRNAKGELTTTVVIGEVVLVHVHEGVAAASPSGKLVVDPARLHPVARMGGNTYSRLTSLFDLPRPDREAQFRGPAAAPREGDATHGVRPAGAPGGAPEGGGAGFPGGTGGG